MSTADDKRKEEELWKLMCRSRFSGWFQSSTKVKQKDSQMKIPVFNRVQREIDEAIEWCDANKIPARIIILKSRQVGGSTYAVARGYHRARSSTASCAILGDDKNTTDKLMEMWRRFAENDTMDKVNAWGNKPTNPQQPTWMSFSHGASLTLETANDPRAGQGSTLQFLHSSETASYRSSGHSTGEDVFSSILNCVPRLPNTLVIIESTAQGTTGVFYTTFMGAVTLDEFKAGKRGNGYIKFFAPWFECDDYQHDGRDGRVGMMPGEADEIMASLNDEERRLISTYGDRITPERLSWRRLTLASAECGGNIQKLHREYPSSPEEAFVTSGNAFFDHDGLTWQEQQIVPQPCRYGEITVDGRGRGAIFHRRGDMRGQFRVWEEPEDGESYLISVDLRVGRQSAGSKRELDTNAVLVFRAGRLDPITQAYTLPRVVAACREDDRSDTDIILHRILCLYRMYGDCLVIPEINNSGNITHQMQQLGITNIWSQPTGQHGVFGQGKTQHVLGFLTNVNTRRQILDNMAMMVREQQWICSCPELLKQMKAFQRNEQGKPEASPGYHDDFVMSAAIGLFGLPRATRYKAARPGSSVDGWSRERLERSSISPMGV